MDTKKNDPFDKFRKATLGGGNPLSGALQGKNARPNDTKNDEAPLPSPASTAVKKSKNANRRLISFHLNNDLHLKLGQLKFEMGTKYDELYNEAIRDLLVKYGKM